MLSYWEHKYFTTYGTIIIGAGISGLFTALFLKQKLPNEEVLVIDKEIFPAASTKNAGFACMGSITELEDDLSASPVANVISLFKKRYEGLQLMREVLGDDKIGYRDNGSYELLTEHNDECLAQLSVWNERLFSIEQRNAFAVSDIHENNFVGFTASIKNELEGEIDTGKMWHSLKSKVQNLGVEILLNTSAVSYKKSCDRFVLETENGVPFASKRLILCTNAFTSKLLPSYEIIPARAQVLITKPIKNLTFNGAYHFDRGYYYFREIDGRVLFGGGRQLDTDQETTNNFGINDLILSDLKSKLAENILLNTPFEIDYNWSGIMGLSNTKEPICTQIDENLFLLAGFGGMGVALAPFMARELLERIISSSKT